MLPFFNVLVIEECTQYSKAKVFYNEGPNFKKGRRIKRPINQKAKTIVFC